MQARCRTRRQAVLRVSRLTRHPPSASPSPSDLCDLFPFDSPRTPPVSVTSRVEHAMVARTSTSKQVPGSQFSVLSSQFLVLRTSAARQTPPGAAAPRTSPGRRTATSCTPLKFSAFVMIQQVVRLRIQLHAVPLVHVAGAAHAAQRIRAVAADDADLGTPARRRTASRRSRSTSSGARRCRPARGRGR